MASLWAGGLAFLLGALHALEPGHGKAAIAAYTIGHRGRLGHVLVLGLSTALAHTATIIVLALLLGGVTRNVAHEHVHQWFEYASAALLVGVGGWMFMRARRRAGAAVNCSAADTGAGQAVSECGCGGAHRARTAGDAGRVGYRLAGVMGLAGGIIPCPSALAALLSAAAIGHFAYGVWSVILFSTGIALTLAAVALVAHWAAGSSRRLLPAIFNNHAAEKWARRAPVVSAVLVLLCGIYSLCRIFWLG